MLARMESYDLFIAAPMSAIAPGDYATGRKDILALMESLSGRHKFGRIYFAGAQIEDSGSFTSEDEALRRDMAALRAARLFVMIYPGKIVTSALVEVGYAMALRLPCLLLVRDRDDLPYLLKQAERAGEAAQLPPIEIQTAADGDWAAAIAHFRDRMKEHGNNERQG